MVIRMKKNQKGFSLIELLVVTVIMGLVVASIYTLYTGTQKTAITSEEVVEVQQNLRFALDQIASDIRLAGFLVPSGTAPFVETPASIIGTDLVINTSMTTRRYARIESFSEPDLTMTVASSEMVDLFETGDTFFIIRPHTYEELSTGVIGTKNRLNRTLVLTSLLPPTGTEYFPGDVIVPASTVEVAYRLVADPNGGANIFLLEREVDGATAVVAGKISDVGFEYISNIDDVVAVRVRIEGQTDETITGQENFSGIKTRALETVVRLRNR